MVGPNASGWTWCRGLATAALVGSVIHPAAGQDAAGTPPGYMGIVVEKGSGEGVRVREVVEGGPCAVAGIQMDDQITAADGRAIRTIDDLRAVVESSQAGVEIRFAITRGDRFTEAVVVPTERPQPEGRRFRNFGPIDDANANGAGAAEMNEGEGGVGGPPLLGVRTVAITAASQNRLNLPSREGALVTSVVTDSPAGQAGIPLDAVIFGVNRRPVRRPDELAEVVRAAGAGASIEIEFFHNGRAQLRRVTLGGGGDGAGNRDGNAGAERMPAPGGAGSGNAGLAERIFQMEQVISEMARRMEALEAELRALRETGPATDEGDMVDPFVEGGAAVTNDDDVEGLPAPQE